MVIHGSYVYIHVRMLFLNLCHSIRCSHKAHQPNVGTSPLFQHGQSVAGASASGKHRVRYNHHSLADIFRKLAIIYYRSMGLLVPVQTDVAYFSHRNQRKQSVHHAESGTQNRNYGKFPSGDFPGGHFT